ncbi:hypothetical protein RchiOBHm_Chr5g0072081 [Rosa chinensis]|uniref:Uncharacterized protein n=1 Tax=Rosa chinensis TaxID=74649 RepID=A0A2P6QKL0_ROSCH|nr:hypothetical protein RchiOBHm_Chr5g0072081 [Rosa chinensis]
MRYMKEIVEDKSLDFFTKWERRGKATYTQEDIDVVRNEWAKFMLKLCSMDLVGHELMLVL